MAIATPKPTETPAPAAPAAAPAPVEADKAPAIDWQARAVEAEKQASKQAKALKDLEAKANANDDVLGKLKALFGPASTDPVAEANALREAATRSTALAQRAIVEAAIVRHASRAGLHDPDDAVRLLGGSVEVDLSTGAVKDPAAISTAIDNLKSAKPYLFKLEMPAAPATTAAPITVKAPTPAAPAAAPTENKPRGVAFGAIFGRR